MSVTVVFEPGVYCATACGNKTVFQYNGVVFEGESKDVYVKGVNIEDTVVIESSSVYSKTLGEISTIRFVK